MSTIDMNIAYATSSLEKTEFLFYNDASFEQVIATKQDQTSEPVIVTIGSHRMMIKRSCDNKIIVNSHIRRIRLCVSLSETELSVWLNEENAKMVQLRLRNENGPPRRNEIDELIAHLRAIYRNSFPSIEPEVLVSGIDIQQEIVAQASGDIVPLSTITSVEVLKLGILPVERLDSFQKFYPHLTGKVSAGICGGYLNAYLSFCDLLGRSPLEEFIWLIENEFQFKKTLDLENIHTMASYDVAPIILALESNAFFDVFSAKNIKFDLEAADALQVMVKRNCYMKEIILNNNGLQKDFFLRFCRATLDNEKTKINALDFSSNIIDDKAATVLAAVSVRLPMFSRIILSNCDLSKKGSLNLLTGLKKSPVEDTDMGSNISLNFPRRRLETSIYESLHTLDMARNNFGSEGLLALAEFLAQRNHVKRLNLSCCKIPLEIIFGALIRGCVFSLQHVNLSGNFFSLQTENLRKFIISSQCLRELDLSSCNLDGFFLGEILTSFSVNSLLENVSLILRKNDFNEDCGRIIKDKLSSVLNLTALDLSDNTFDNDEGLCNLLEGLKAHPTLTRICLDRVFHKRSNIKKKLKSAESLNKIIDMRNIFTIKKLTHLSLANNSLGENFRIQFEGPLLNRDEFDSTGLLFFDLSRNEIVDDGAHLLSKFVSIVPQLSELNISDNLFTLNGWAVISRALSNNRSILFLPVSLEEFLMFLKSDVKKANVIFNSIQSCLSRNASKIMVLQSFSPVADIAHGYKNVVSIPEQDKLDHLVIMQRKLMIDLENLGELVNEEQKMKNTDIINRTNALLDEIANFNTFLSENLRQLLYGKTKLNVETERSTELFVNSIFQSQDAELDMIKQDLVKRATNQIPHVLFQLEKANEVDFEAFKNNLNVLLELGTSNGFDNHATKTKLKSSLLSVLEFYIEEKFDELIKSFKTVLFEKLTAKLEALNLEIIGKIEESKPSGKAFSENSSLNTEKDLHPVELDFSKLKENHLMNSKPLEHTTKSRIQAANRRKSSKKLALPLIENLTGANDECEINPSKIDKEVLSKNSVELSTTNSPIVRSDVQAKDAHVDNNGFSNNYNNTNEVTQPALPSIFVGTKPKIILNERDNSPKKELENLANVEETSISNSNVEEVSIKSTPLAMPRSNRPKTNSNENKVERVEVENETQKFNLKKLEGLSLSLPLAERIADSSPEITSNDEEHSRITPKTLSSTEDPKVCKTSNDADLDKRTLETNIQSENITEDKKKKKGFVSKIGNFFRRKDKKDDMLKPVDSIIKNKEDNLDVKIVEHNSHIEVVLKKGDDIKTNIHGENTFETKKTEMNMTTQEVVLGRLSDESDNLEVHAVVDDSSIPLEQQREVHHVQNKAAKYGVKLPFGSKADELNLSSIKLKSTKNVKIDSSSAVAQVGIPFIMQSNANDGDLQNSVEDRSDSNNVPQRKSDAVEYENGISILNHNNNFIGISEVDKVSYQKEPIIGEAGKVNPENEVHVKEQDEFFQGQSKAAKYGIKLPFGLTGNEVDFSSVRLKSTKKVQEPEILPATDAPMIPILSTFESESKDNTSGVDDSPNKATLCKEEANSALTSHLQEGSGTGTCINFRKHLKTNASLDSLENSDWQKQHLEWIIYKLEKHKIILVNGVQNSLLLTVQDGVTMLELVEALCKDQPFPKYKKNAVLPVHKIDNLNILLTYLKNLNGVNFTVTAEDLFNGEPKKILILMELLEKTFL